MSFTNPVFLFFFLPIIGFFYLLFHRKIFIINTVLAFFSLLLYQWSAGAFIILLIISILFNYILGIILDLKFKKLIFKKILLWIAVLLNIGILSYYKYSNFFVEQVNFLGKIAVQEFNEIPNQNSILPIGISFFTFHSLSYIVDIYKGKSRAMRNPITFILYIAFFPQLIAGPIIRYHEISHQLASRSCNWENIRLGTIRFTYGLIKKVLIADNLAEIANFSFDNVENISAADAYIGLIAYTIQIYFDFSGYSDMAIGLAKFFSFSFPENFNRPYAATSITDFWRRWHISLSSWFRDYVYIPLGGSRISQVTTYRNLIFVFFLTGFWHGANWTFILWGLYYAVILVIEKILFDRNHNTTNRTIQSLTLIILTNSRRAITLIIVSLGWVLFRSPSLNIAQEYYSRMLGNSLFYLSENLLSLITIKTILAFFIGSSIFFIPGEISTGLFLLSSRSWTQACVAACIILIGLPLSLAQIISGSSSPFLYFQF